MRISSQGLSFHFIHSELGSSCCHSSPPFSPYIRMRIPFSSPTEIWLAINTPLAPPSNRNSTEPSSSKVRPSTKVVRSAHKWLIFKPVINSTRLAACTPISPIQQLTPALVGSSRQDACLSKSPLLSANQPCGYSATTLRILPSAPAAIRTLASRTNG